MADLTQKHCVPCEGWMKPMAQAEAAQLLPQAKDWQLASSSGIDCIQRAFTFKDFASAMKFVNSVAALAESEGHHPDITINWNKVTLQLSTHAIKGLSENDFILASKINLIQ